MTRRTTSRAPGMFPGRQPSSHPNPCLGGVCSRYAGSERTLRRSRKVQNDGCQAGSRDGFESPGKRACADTDGGLETRQSEARWQTRRLPASKRDGGRGSCNAPRACHKAASRGLRTRRRRVPQVPGADRTTRRGMPASAVRRGLRDTPPGGYCKRPLPSRPHDTARVPTSVRAVSLTACRWRVRHTPPTATAGHAAGLVPQCPGSGPGNASRAAIPTQRGAGPCKRPGAGPHKRAAGRVPNTSGAGLRGFRARRSSYVSPGASVRGSRQRVVRRSG